jgi:predicted DNA-binding ribbon-helix-helix protein
MEFIVAASRLVNRNFVTSTGRTSMRLEPELWDALLEVCQREGQDSNQVIRNIDSTRIAGTRTSAVRIFLLHYFRCAATETGHAMAGHLSQGEVTVNLTALPCHLRRAG